MIDIDKYIEAIQIKWIKKLTSKNSANWKVIPIMVLNFDTYSLSILVTDATYVIFGIINDLAIIIFPNWKVIPFYYFNKFGPELMIFNMSINTIKSIDQFTNNLSDYYLNLLKSWISIGPNLLK
jgi:hypothetical protein